MSDLLTALAEVAIMAFGFGLAFAIGRREGRAVRRPTGNPLQLLAIGAQRRAVLDSGNDRARQRLEEYRQSEAFGKRARNAGGAA